MIEPLNEDELRQLAIYSEECLRGLPHKEIYEKYIAELIQRWLDYDLEQKRLQKRFKVIKFR
jgi:hypothetical protein